MENAIVIYTASYVAVRLVILMGIGYALYCVTRRTRVPARVPARLVVNDRQRGRRSLNSMCDDRC